MAQGMVRGGLSGSLGAVGLAAVLVLLSGCGGSGDGPEPTPTVEPTTATVEPQPEPEPTDEVPEEPEAPLPRNGTPDERDAEAAGEFFLDLYTYVLRTGDTRQWQERSAPECGFCANVLEMAVENESAGAQFFGVEITGQPAQFVAFDETIRVFAVEIAYDSGPMEARTPDGTVLRSFTADAGYLLMDVAYEPWGGWQLLSGGNHKESHL